MTNKSSISQMFAKGHLGTELDLEGTLWGPSLTSLVEQKPTGYWTKLMMWVRTVDGIFATAAVGVIFNL